jgi:hypothetical protein
VNDNAGAGIISIGQDTYNINFKNCRFIGTSNSAAYPKSAGFSFDSCTFVGKVERIFGSSDKSKATFFKDCLFTMDKKMSPTGKVFGDRCEFYEAQNVVFDRCRFDADSTALPVFNNKEIVFVNCSFSQDNNTDFNASAIFKGTTHFYIPEKKIIKTEESKFEGEVILSHN